MLDKQKSGVFLDLYAIFRDINIVVKISVGRFICSGVGSAVGDSVESGDYGEVVGEVGSRDSKSSGKYFKCGLDVIIDDSLFLGVDRVVGAEVYRNADGKLHMWLEEVLVYPLVAG